MEQPLLKKEDKLLTFKNLIEETAALGFEVNIESSEALLFAARRALMTIYTDRGDFSTIKFTKRGFPVKPSRPIKHKGGEAERISFSARAMSFRASGSGILLINDEAGERSITFNGEQEIKAFLFGNGFIEFNGDYAYTVSGLSFFSEIYSPSEEDLPVYRGFAEYDMRELTDDFLSFVGNPYSPEHREISGAALRGTSVRLPEEYDGEVCIDYRKAPVMPTGDIDEELQLPCGCVHLLPLITAAYIWLDDDEGKAQYYMSLYREGMAALNVYSRLSVNTEYRDVTGWA